MEFIIRKGPERLPLYWGVDGWQSNSYWAIKYPSKEAAKKALKLLDVQPGAAVFIEGYES